MRGRPLPRAVATTLRIITTDGSSEGLHAALGNALTDEGSGQTSNGRVEAPARLDVTRPQFSIQELRTLQLYAKGLDLATVARELGVKVTTAKEYVQRIREKYAAVGRAAPTKLHLRINAQQDGLLDE